MQAKVKVQFKAQDNDLHREQAYERIKAKKDEVDSLSKKMKEVKAQVPLKSEVPTQKLK